MDRCYTWSVIGKNTKSMTLVIPNFWIICAQNGKGMIGTWLS